jgi:hypothetical protein
MYAIWCNVAVVLYQVLEAVKAAQWSWPYAIAISSEAKVSDQNALNHNAIAYADDQQASLLHVRVS